MGIISWICVYLTLPSWKNLEAGLPSVAPPVYHEKSLPENFVSSENKPILYRDENALNPYHHQVWFAFEAKGIDYVTILVESSESNNEEDIDMPKVTWPDGTVQNDVLQILEKIEKEYPEKEPNFFPKISAAVDSVRCNIMRFKGVFPRNTKSTNLAPYLFRNEEKFNGDLVPLSSHKVTLEEIDEVMEEYYSGSFLCGKDLTAADIMWMPFLERYAVQLPLLNPELRPRSDNYESIEEWFDVMEKTIPCYQCRVQGDSKIYSKSLETFVKEYNERNKDNDEVPTLTVSPSASKSVGSTVKNDIADELWRKYAEGKPFLSKTPGKECCNFLVRHRHEILDEATSILEIDDEKAEESLLEIISAITEEDNVVSLSSHAQSMASFLDRKISVPRDMGVIPASTIERLLKD